MSRREFQETRPYEPGQLNDGILVFFQSNDYLRILLNPKAT